MKHVQRSAFAGEQPHQFSQAVDIARINLCQVIEQQQCILGPAVVFERARKLS
jgi:hypothetical protein